MDGRTHDTHMQIHAQAAHVQKALHADTPQVQHEDEQQGEQVEHEQHELEGLHSPKDER